jgi:cell wall assembly regulator SMI1
MSSSPWLRIDSWLAEHAPKVLALLRPPLDDAGFAKLEAAAGKPLPASLALAYRAHDGARSERPTILGAVRAPKDALWAHHMAWMSADSAVGRLLFMRELPTPWPAELLPIADDAGGNLLVADLETGAILAWDHETATTTRLADDLTTWMTQLADDMDARLVVAGSAEDDADDSLELLDAPPGPPPPAPIILPDRAARVFVEVLCEKKYAALHKGADLEPLIAELTLALAIPVTKERKKKVIALLEESDAIDEIFTTDDKLEGLVDEIH